MGLAQRSGRRDRRGRRRALRCGRVRPHPRPAPDLALRGRRGPPLAARPDGAASPPGERVPVPDPRSSTRRRGEGPRGHRAGARGRQGADSARSSARAGRGRGPRKPTALGYLIIDAELEGSSAAARGAGSARPTRSLDERIPPSPPRERDEALAELATRYVEGHGPAQDIDLAWWSGLTLRGRAGRSRRSPPLARGDRRADLLRLPDSEAPVAPSPAVVHLLPNYDELLIAFRDRTDAMDPGLPPPARVAEEILAHVIVRNGLGVGGWREGPTALDASGRAVTRWCRSTPPSESRSAPRSTGFAASSAARSRSGPRLRARRARAILRCRRVGRFGPPDSPGRDSSVGRARD